MRIEGAGRKLLSDKLNESVFEWIHERCSKGLQVSRKLIIKKAIVIHDDIVKEDKSNEEFKASTGWLRGFMKRYSLSLWRKTSVAQKDPDQFIDKLVYIFCFTFPPSCQCRRYNNYGRNLRLGRYGLCYNSR